MRRAVIGVTGLEKTVNTLPVSPQPQQYCQAILDAGAVPLAIPAFVTEEEALRYVDLVDGMVFIGGPDIPGHFFGEERPELNGDYPLLEERAAALHLAVAEAAFRRGMPFLGVCLGCQELNVASGGKLIQHLGELTPAHRAREADPVTKVRPDVYHFADLEPGSLPAALFGTGRIRVNSCHHQAVDPAAVGKNFRIAARSSEDGVVEAIEWPGEFFRLGLQWHPERIDDGEHRRKIFGALIRSARKFQDAN